MQTRKDRWQEDLFVAVPLSQLVPDEHLLRRVDAVLDLSWIHDEVRHCYCQDNGAASIDPEAALRLMLAGFFEGIVHDRRLMRRAQTDVAFRWFAGYRLDENLPDHSSMTRLRQRWGAALFKSVLQRTVQACADAGLVNGRTVHIDATLIRADVSWDSLSVQHAEQVLSANHEEAPTDEPPGPSDPGRARTKPAKPKMCRATVVDAARAQRRHR